jgi:hypothetical protein
MTEQVVRKARGEGEAEASQLVALIDRGDVDGALALNGQVAATVPHLHPVEVWFVRRISDRWGKPSAGLASDAWEAARAVADPALEAVAKQAWFETWQWWQGEKAAADKRPDWAKADWDEPIEAAPAPVAEPVAEPLLKELPTEEPKQAAPKPEPKVERLLFDIPPAPLPPPDATEAEALTYPRGLVGHIVQYMVDTAELPDRSMALCGALLVCALAIARKVLGPNNNAVALLTILIAESGAGKQHIINCIKLLLRAIGMPDVCVGSSIASIQSIEEVLQGKPPNLEGKPTALILNDEYGSFLNRISTQTGNVSEIPSTLQTLWGWPPQLEWEGAIKTGKDNTKVWGPAFMIFGSSTERAFFTALKSKEVASGFVNRHLLFNAGRGAIERIDAKYDWTQCPVWLVDAFKEIAGEPAPLDNRPLQRKDNRGKPTGIFLRDWRRMTWGEGAKEAWRHFENKEIRNLPSADEREMWIRAPEIALRLATIVATFAFRGSTIVTAEDYDWARKVSRKSCAQIAEGLQRHMLENFEQADLVELVREEFRKKTELRWGQIRKLLERKTGDYNKIERVIQHLQLTNEIHDVSVSGRAGRPTDRWRWTAADRKGK